MEHLLGRGRLDLVRSWAIGRADVHGFAPPLTSFVGRAAAVREVAGLLAQYRLVTVTGPGGSGKTRLAGEVAKPESGRFADGYGWWSWQRFGTRRRSQR